MRRGDRALSGIGVSSTETDIDSGCADVLATSNAASPGVLLAWCPEGATGVDRARVGGEMLVGRGTGVSWTIRDSRLSTGHFALSPGETRVAIRDLDSRNGTFVNGVAL